MGLLDSFKALFGGSPGARGGSGKKMPRVDIAKRFELRGKTGQGSMSKVFQAYDRTIGRIVCLKILDKEKTAKFESRFPAALKKPPEGEICMGLRHDHIVQTYDHGLTTKGEPFLVMEWVEGKGLNYFVETRDSNSAAKP